MRILKNLQMYNERGHHQYALSLSIGVVAIDAGSDSSTEELVARADEAMYQHKRGKRQSRLGPAISGAER